MGSVKKCPFSLRNLSIVALKMFTHSPIQKALQLELILFAVTDIIEPNLISYVAF